MPKGFPIGTHFVEGSPVEFFIQSALPNGQIKSSSATRPILDDGYVSKQNCEIRDSTNLYDIHMM